MVWTALLHLLRNCGRELGFPGIQKSRSDRKQIWLLLICFMVAQWGTNSSQLSFASMRKRQNIQKAVKEMISQLINQSINQPTNQLRSEK